jgi:hypothetical protein
VDILILEACADSAMHDDKVVCLGQERAGLECCTEEYFDNQEASTNAQRSRRVSGRAIRT